MAKNVKIIFFYSILFLFILAYITTAKNYDYDLWARLVVGKEFFQTGHIFVHDFISYIPTHYIIDHEWGSGVVFYFIKQFFGVQGFVFLQTILLFLTFVFIIKTINLRGVKTTSAYNFLFYFFTFLALSEHINYVIRCQMFSFLFFTIFLYLLEKTRLKNYQSSKIAIYLPLIMLFWCNLHGGCVISFCLIVLYMVGEFLNKKPFKKYLLAFFTCGLSLFVNPWGYKYLAFLFQTNAIHRTYIIEWFSPFNNYYLTKFLDAKFFILTLSSVEILYLLKKIRTKVFDFDKTKFLVLLSTLVMAAKYIKLMPFCVINFACFVYEDFYNAFNFLTNKIFERKKFFKELIIYLFFTVFSVYSIISNSFGPYIDFERFPVKAVEFVKLNKLDGNLLADYTYNSYIAYKLYPQNKIFMDGRYDTVYAPQYLELLMKIYDVNGGYKKITSRYHTDIILLDNYYSSICSRIIRDNDYVLVYKDKKSSVFVLKSEKKKNYKKPSDDINYYKQRVFNTDIDFKEGKWQAN